MFADTHDIFANAKAQPWFDRNKVDPVAVAKNKASYKWKSYATIKMELVEKAITDNLGEEWVQQQLSVYGLKLTLAEVKLEFEKNPALVDLVVIRSKL